MSLQELTIEQKHMIVALRPELEARYQCLDALLNTAADGQDVEMWKIDLAVSDLESVIDTMFPRVADSDDAEGF